MMRILLILIVCVFKISAKNFTRCELVRELGKQNFPIYHIKDWVCLVEAESSRRTDAIGGPDDDGSYDYGLFQINDRYWCTHSSSPGKECRVRCKDLLSADITKASECAKMIYSRQGFDAWLGWVNECKGKPLPDISDCRDQNI